MSIVLNVASAKSPTLKTFGISVVGTYADELGRADYEIARPLGNSVQQLADVLSIHLALSSIHPKVRATSTVLVRSASNVIQLFVKGEDGAYPPTNTRYEDKIAKARELVEKFNDVQFVKHRDKSDLYFEKAKVLASRAAENIITPGTIDESIYPK